MPMFSRFKSKRDASNKDRHHAELTNGNLATPQKPRYQSSWSSKVVVPEEVEELLHACTAEMKSRAEALNAPFLLLPFRPNSDPEPARTFIRNYFKANSEGQTQYSGVSLQQELRLTEPAILCSIVKWCWARIPHGVVSWPVYEGFKIGEKECNMARNAFDTFIPISAETSARKNIIVDFFDLLMAVAAHGKTNGMGGRKLSRLAGWWAFEHSDDGQGFENGYKTWTAAADACSHLFFAYLRSLSPDTEPSMTVIERIPRSLQALLASTEYPPERPTLLQSSTPKVVMLVDNVSPTPFALIRRAKHFEYRDNDKLLRQYSEYEDPVEALTEECRRVLYALSSTNSKVALSSHDDLGQGQESWSAFQNMGFSDMDTKSTKDDQGAVSPVRKGFNSMPASRSADMGRPTTPSWADFTSTGFVDDGSKATSLILPPDQVLPPIGNRAQTSATSGRDQALAPGELAAITVVELDDAFWWVWITSLAGEEPAERKAVFGRCALVETRIMNGQWLIMEEQLKGLSNDATEGMFVVHKKSRFGLSRRSRRGSKPSRVGNADLMPPTPNISSISPSASRISLAPDQQTRIKAAAAELTRRQSIQGKDMLDRSQRDVTAPTHKKVSSGIITDASPAMKWASAYDLNALDYQNTEPPPPPSASKSVVSAPRSTGSDEFSRPPVAQSGMQTTTEPHSLSPVVEDHHIPSLPPKDSPVEANLPMNLPVADLRPVAADVSPVSPIESPSDVVEGIALEPTVSAQPPISPAEPIVPSSPIQKETAQVVPLSPTKSIDRKPVPAPKEHPALRNQEYDEVPAAPVFQSPNSPPGADAPDVPRAPVHSQAPQNPAALAAQLAMGGQTSTNLESRFHDAKAKKQSGGLKKLFGRNKDSGLAPSGDASVGRRISLIRKKQPLQNPAAKSSMTNVTTPTGGPEYSSHPMPTVTHPVQGSQARGVSHEVEHEDSNEDADPHTEFARFDQGPMEDMPAMMPQDSDPELVSTPVAAIPTPVKNVSPEPAPHFETDLASRIAPPQMQVPEPQPEEHIATPKVESPEVLQEEVKSITPTSPERNRGISDAAASETTMDDSRDAPAVQDRWATIRENAAKRAAAAKAGEENQGTQSRQSMSGKTDDGETSGEETIESRVARIKARVAELTGGMENNMPQRRNLQ